MTYVAYADRAGVIGFGLKCPPGALPIGQHPNLDRLKTVVSAAARLNYDNETLLTPGILEAATSNDALDAIIFFSCRIAGRLREDAS